MVFRQSSRDIAAPIRLLLLLVSKITHIYFSFLLGLDLFIFCPLIVARWSACLSRN